MVLKPDMQAVKTECYFLSIFQELITASQIENRAKRNES
jgi:hypothetical protein